MIISLFLVIMNFSFAQEANVPSVLENRKGIEALKKQNPAEAQKHFLEALSKKPLESRLQLNLGYSFEQLGQLDKARSAYDIAAQLGKDDEALFVANFNRGVLYQKEKKTDEALAAYQEALKYRPDSIEAKTNIELLTQSQDGKGKGEEQKDKKEGEEGSDSKDKKDKEQKDEKDQKDQDPKDGEQKKDENKPKQYQKNKPQPKPFKSEELTQGDVNKILGEIKQQEQKIRAEFNKKEGKDQGKEKDW